jgi:hypothetical protein
MSEKDMWKEQTKFKMKESRIERPDMTLDKIPVVICVNCSLKFEVANVEGDAEFDIPCPRCLKELGVVIEYVSKLV